MWPVIIASIALAAVAILLYRQLDRLHGARVADQQANAEGWRQLALALTNDQRDAANRLLIRSGVAPAPVADKDRAAPAEMSHEPDDQQWVAEDERDEIEEKAKEALRDPFRAQVLEDAAKYDPLWRAVHDRYVELKRQVS